MDAVITDLLLYLTRWSHVIAAIMWIGNSFYFMWLDANINRPLPDGEEPLGPNVTGRLWMVHGGGYYRVEKNLITPGGLPAVLHWFKWEATFTWLTGFLLFILVFYRRDAALLVDPQVLPMAGWQGIALSLGIFAGAWLIYDFFWETKLASQGYLGHIISVIFAVGVILLCCKVFSGRGAFVQVGATFATIMVLNVWVRILPGQKAMIAASERGEQPDLSRGQNAKKRSTHNSYITLPVLFTMLSGHFQTATSHSQNWLVLILLTLFGVVVRHMMIRLDVNLGIKAWLAPAAAVLLLLGALLWPRAPLPQAQAGPPVTFGEAYAVIYQRCVSCHAKNPSDKDFGPLVQGVHFDDPRTVLLHVETIRQRVVVTKDMPLINKTEITDAERNLIDRWTAQELAR